MQVRGGPKTVVTIYLTSKKAKRCLLICRGSNQVKGKSKSRVSSGRREQSVTAAPRLTANRAACAALSPPPAVRSRRAQVTKPSTRKREQLTDHQNAVPLLNLVEAVPL